jgi:hypothetical protein
MPTFIFKRSVLGRRGARTANRPRNFYLEVTNFGAICIELESKLSRRVLASSKSPSLSPIGRASWFASFSGWSGDGALLFRNRSLSDLFGVMSLSIDFDILAFTSLYLDSTFRARPTGDTRASNRICHTKNLQGETGLMGYLAPLLKQIHHP